MKVFFRAIFSRFLRYWLLFNWFNCLREGVGASTNQHGNRWNIIWIMCVSLWRLGLGQLGASYSVEEGKVDRAETYTGRCRLTSFFSYIDGISTQKISKVGSESISVKLMWQTCLLSYTILSVPREFCNSFNCRQVPSSQPLNDRSVDGALCDC